jgi:hypothetical protein
MKGLYICSVVILAGLISFLAAAQTPAANKPLSLFEQTAVANEKSLIEAEKKDDGTFFKRALADDFLFVGIDGQLLEGEEAVDNLGDPGLVELTPYDIKVVPLGDTGAVVTYDAIIRDAPEEDQGPPPRYQHISSVWGKEGGQWKLKFHQATATHWGDW